ncbi:MAG: recombinase family protein [Boseongicola sp.]|nr:recombinase family protein [Boseongicola sp.]
MTPGLTGTGLCEGRVQSSHVRRKAIVYVRQSTPGQVERNCESTLLQYGLTDRARQLGWAEASTEVIDDDLGCSARRSGTRKGFMTLAAEVGLGLVGIVISSEVSRLARNLSEWGRLLELCDLTDTLIADTESLYDLRRPNDRFLLGIRGTVSEAEIHTLRLRMHAGREAKAARGELAVALPRGYVRDASGRTVLDPDVSVQARIRGIFRTFARHGSLSATLRALAADGQGVPVRRANGPRRGELEWSPPSSAALHGMLTSPVYAGAFVWGRAAGGASAGLPVEKRWRHLLKDQHPAYITWEEFELTQRQLANNRWPTRGLGGGLLSGLLFCGRCGQGMTVSYRDGGGEGLRYSCRGKRDYGGSTCQSLSSPGLERFASEAVVNALSPASVALSVAALQQAEADRTAEHGEWHLRIARAERDAADAHRAYRAVDPANRLVAQTLEDDWEAALAECRQLKDAYQRHCGRAPVALSAQERRAIEDATSGIAALWNDGVLTKSERAELMRLMIERVTVEVVGDSERVKVDMQWYGGARSRAEIRRPVRYVEQLSYYHDLCARIAALKTDGRSYGEIADVLNETGWEPARKDAFTEASVANIARKSGLGMTGRRRRPPPARRGRDEWLIDDLARKTAVPKSTLHVWIRKGKLEARKEEQRGEGGARRRWLVRADQATRDAIRAWRERPARFRSRQGIPVFPSRPVQH